MNEIKIGNFVIGQKKEPFIIGEAGINHNGEIKKAFEMIELGKKSGLKRLHAKGWFVKKGTFGATQKKGKSTGKGTRKRKKSRRCRNAKGNRFVKCPK